MKQFLALILITGLCSYIAGYKIGLINGCARAVFALTPVGDKRYGNCYKINQ